MLQTDLLQIASGAGKEGTLKCWWKQRTQVRTGESERGERAERAECAQDEAASALIRECFYI